MAKLTIRRGGVLEQEFELDDRELRIGRGEQNEIVLADPTKSVSRAHAKLRQDNGAYELIDLNSQNGIWVDGERQPRITLRPGVTATLGDYTLALESEATAYQAEEFADGSATVYYPPPDVAHETPSTERPLTPPVPARPGPRPPMRLSKPMLFGGCAVLVLLVVLLSRFLRDPRTPSSSAPPPTPPITETDAGRGSTPSSREIRDQQLASAEDLLKKGDFDGALAQIDTGLKSAPNDQELSDLQARVLEEKKRAAATGVTVPRPRVDPRPSNCRPAEKPADCTARIAEEERVQQAQRLAAEERARALANRYDQGRAALEAGRFQAALAQLQAVAREQPGYKDVDQLIERAKANIRDAAQAAFDEGNRRENAAEFLAAVQQFERAKQTDSSFAAVADAAIRRVRETMKTEGTKAFTDAGIAAKFRGQTKRSIELYERAYQYLPEDDPNRKIAKEKLDELRGK